MAEAPHSKPGTERPAKPAERHTPRWVKVSAFVALAIAVLVVAALLLGGGRHGPRRHVPSGDNEGGPATTALSEHQPPERDH